MNDINFFAIVAAVLPTLLLCYYIYSKDRVEKEPPLLLAGLFGSGVLCSVAAHYISPMLSTAADRLFEGRISYGLTGVMIYDYNADKIAYSALVAFICIAAVEELLKFAALLLITHRNKNFNCLFDGLIYSVFVSLGFGIVENIVYCIRTGFDSLLLRLVVTVPSHFFYGVIMGFFYALWHVYRRAGKQERALVKSGVIGERKVMKSFSLLILGICVPVLIHGFSSFADMLEVDELTVCNYIMVAVLYAVCFFVTHYLSKKDAQSGKLADAIIAAKHPEFNLEDGVSGNE